MRRNWPTGKQSIVLRQPAGFGDSIYSIATVIILKKEFPKITIRTRHPTMFEWIPGVTGERWRKGGEDIAVHYAGRKQCHETNQWQDLLFALNIDITTPFRIEWPVQNKALVERVRQEAGERRVCVVSSPHTIFGRRDGYGMELTPKWDVYQKLISSFSRQVFFVQCGCIQEYDKFLDLGMDLTGKVSDTDTMDLGATCDLVLGQHGWAIPLAEAFDKPLFVIYSSRGLRSSDPYIRQCTAQKTFSKPTSKYAVDDEEWGVISAKAKEAYGIPFL